MKNFRKVLRNVSEADYERFLCNFVIRRFTGKLRLSKYDNCNLDKFKINSLAIVFISTI